MFELGGGFPEKPAPDGPGAPVRRESAWGIVQWNVAIFSGGRFLADKAAVSERNAGMRKHLLHMLAACAAFNSLATATLKPGYPLTPDVLGKVEIIQGEVPKAWQPGKVYILECWATGSQPSIAVIPRSHLAAILTSRFQWRTGDKQAAIATANQAMEKAEVREAVIYGAYANSLETDKPQTFKSVSVRRETQTPASNR